MLTRLAKGVEMQTVTYYHTIEADFRNEYDNRVMVVTCPVSRQSVAINGAFGTWYKDKHTCTCGSAL